MIPEQTMEAALFKLDETADEYGKACGRVSYMEDNLKRVKALAELDAEAPEGVKLTEAMRERIALTSAAYLTAMKDKKGAIYIREKLRAQRQAAEYTIEVWRSQYSGRKAGVL